MNPRGAPADGAAAGGPAFGSDWLARRLAALGVPLRGAQLCVAYSGGADSLALLATLAAMQKRWRLRLRALHVDHALQAGSAGRARSARAAARTSRARPAEPATSAWSTCSARNCRRQRGRNATSVASRAMESAPPE